ncbi:hypothetical protein ACHAWF_012431 [Thalassiosira exigua]
MEIVIECLLGWDPKTQTGKGGVFRRVLVWAKTDEEQGRKTLHSHWQVWVEGFNECRDALYHEDLGVRAQARKALIEYIDKVISARYCDGELGIAYNCPCSPPEEDVVVVSKASDLVKERDLNILRLARHKDHCLDVMDKVLECIECQEPISTGTMVDAALRQWHSFSDANSGKQHPCRGIDSPVLLLRKEWLDVAAYRYPFDFDGDGWVS